MAIFSEKWLFLPFFAYFGHFGRFWLDFPGQGHFLLGARHLLGGNRLKMAILLPPPGGAWGLLEPSRILRLVRKEMATHSRNAGQGRFWSKWSFWTLRG